MENVHKTRNLGALARTCDAVGIGVIHAIADEESRVNLGHKTAGGTEKWISVQRHATIADAYADFRGRGFTLLAADVAADARDFREIDYTEPTVIVVGSELDGLSHAASADADVRIRVPLMGMVESLNVSVAAGVILYEAARQREKAGLYAHRRISDEDYEQLLFEWLHPAVAHYCQKRALAYPALDEHGNIEDAISGNRREGLSYLTVGRGEN